MNLAGAAVPLVLLVLTVPRYLDVLGTARYGVLVVVWVLLGYFGAFDLGLGRAAANRIARLHAGPREERAAVFSTALTLSLVLAAVGGLLLFGVGRVLVGSAFDFPEPLRSETLAALPWLAAAVPLVTVSSLFRAALEARERFVAANVVAATGLCLFQLVPLGIAHWRGPNLTWLVAGAALASLAGALVGLAACLELLPRRGAPAFERAAAGTLLRYGGWVSVTGVIAPVLSALDRLVIAASVGPRAVTGYTVPFALVSRVEIVPGSLARTLFPRLSMLAAEEARGVARESLHSLAVVLTPLVVLGLVVVAPFLDVWLGGELGAASASVGQIILLGLWANGLAYVPFVLLQAQGRPDLTAKFHALELVPYLLALWLGLSLAGIEGAAWAWTLRVGVDAVLLFRVSALGAGAGAGLVPAAAVALAFAGSITVFVEPLARLGLGGGLVLATLAWAWRSAPDRLRRPVLRAVLRVPAFR